MKIETLFFASARDAVGAPRRTLEVDVGTRVGDVFELLVRAHPGLAPVRPSLRFAVNEDFVNDEHVLAEGDCLALLPPVSGG